MFFTLAASPDSRKGRLHFEATKAHPIEVEHNAS